MLQFWWTYIFDLQWKTYEIPFDWRSFLLNVDKIGWFIFHSFSVSMHLHWTVALAMHKMRIHCKLGTLCHDISCVVSFLHLFHSVHTGTWQTTLRSLPTYFFLLLITNRVERCYVEQMPTVIFFVHKIELIACL